MSRLERELRVPSRRRTHASHGGSRTNSGVTTPEESFDADVGDFGFGYPDQIALDNPELQKQLQQDLKEVKMLRSPTFGSFSREESRDNSVVASIIGDEDDEGDESSRSNSRSSSVVSTTGVRIYDAQDVIEALARPRNKINTDSRMYLIGQAYKMVIRRPDSVEVNEADMEQLIGYIRAARSDTETVLTIRLAAAYAATDSDEVGTQVMDDLIPLLMGKILDFNNSSLVRSQAIVAYFSMLLVIFDGSDCYSVAGNVGQFLELIEGYQTENNSPEDSRDWDVVTSSVNGIGIVLSLLYKSGRNDVNSLIEDAIPRLMPFLTGEFPRKVKKAVCIAIGLMYEVYSYGDEDEEDEEDLDDDKGPYYATEDLKAAINTLAQESSKKVGKKNRKETRSIFREVVRTIDLHGKEDEEEDEGHVISRFSITKGKQISIKTWFAFVRLLHLKYLFDTQLSSHYLYSKELREFLVSGSESRNYRDEDDDDFGDGTSHEWKSHGGKVTDKKREQQVRKARDRKLADRMDELNI